MTQSPVRKRQVFFFSGFDPKGAAYYHRLYTEGAAGQQQATGNQVHVGPRERTDDRHVQRWRVTWQGDPANWLPRWRTRLDTTRPWDRRAPTMAKTSPR